MLGRLLRFNSSRCSKTYSVLKNQFEVSTRPLTEQSNPASRLLNASQFELTNKKRVFFSSSSSSSSSSDDDFQTKREDSVKDLLEKASTFVDAEPQTVDDVWSSPVYPKGVHVKMEQIEFRPKTDPAKTSVLCFPGQGSQMIGMGSDLLSFPNVSKMYEIASEILNFDLLDVSVNGPQTKLNQTENCQAAIFVHSLATVEKLKVQEPKAIENCVAVAGFSSGEYAALVFAGALSFQDGVKLLSIRGRAMAAASEMVPGGMMTVWTLPEFKINFVCRAAKEWASRKGVEDPVCSVANYLYPQCKVIAGNQQCLEFLEMNCKSLGIKRVKRLPVSGAFHTILMKPAEPVLSRALKEAQFSAPLISVHSNLDGHAYSKGKGASQSAVAQRLISQLCEPVKWEQTMQIIYGRTSETTFPKTFECGPGRTLTNILKQVNLKAWKESFNP